MADALSISTFAPEMNHIPAGARVDRAYYAVPTLYTSGSEYDTEIEAMEAAIAHARTRTESSPFAKTTVTVDLRWAMSWAPSLGNPSSGSDFVVERTVYKDIPDAEEALARRKKFIAL